MSKFEKKRNAGVTMVASRADHHRDFRGAHAPSRAHFGALAEISGYHGKSEARDGGGAIASTRGACDPQSR
jgi:hypothetical protein